MTTITRKAETVSAQEGPDKTINIYLQDIAEFDVNVATSYSLSLEKAKTLATQLEQLIQDISETK